MPFLCDGLPIGGHLWSSEGSGLALGLGDPLLPAGVRSRTEAIEVAIDLAIKLARDPGGRSGVSPAARGRRALGPSRSRGTARFLGWSASEGGVERVLRLNEAAPSVQRVPLKARWDSACSA
ncbi:MAG: hypothetical protein CBC48_16635 [bacterium TMED88]|nr:hypothetical protein [Deltaproteobacteria bacterium]OUV25259.1 MAG: hypothetical protein CBC48_16635 [bacterium TMED88]